MIYNFGYRSKFAGLTRCSQLRDRVVLEQAAGAANCNHLAPPAELKLVILL